MMGVWMILAAIVVMALSGVPAYAFPRRSSIGQKITVSMMVAGGALGLYALARSFAAEPQALKAAWALPFGRFYVEVDALGAFFLALVFLVPALSSIYGLGYWKQVEHADNGRRVGLSLGLLAAAMATVVIARDGVLFMIAWEVMALSAYFAATAESDEQPVREAGWIYLIATHVGTMFLLAMFAYWRSATGSFDLVPNPQVPQATAGTIFVLAVIGFGFKAGLMPLHVWLPGAHSNAPSHVSAVMSGVMLKMGIYGIVRTASLFPMPAAWWGAVLLAAGAATGVAGIAFAIGQTDVKRLLAYSSIENIGIVAMGVGLALLGISGGRSDWILLGMGAALFHVWNHGLFKSLLFYGAGAVIHATGTRNIDALGGLGKRMPWTMAFFVLGAVAICALPPLNGFAGELLLYVGLFRTLGADGGAVAAQGPAAQSAATAAVALAMIGALAVAAFVKLVGALFLGSPRSPAGARAHDPSRSMIFSMTVVSLGCMTLGLFPALVAPILEAAALSWAPSMGATVGIESLLPLRPVGASALALAVTAACIALAGRILPRFRETRKGVTWDCGYAEPTGRMEYTGSSFGRPIVELFKYVVYPKNPRISIRGPFPEKTRYEGDVPDTIYERLVLPLVRLVSKIAPRFRFLQQGQTHLYVLYIFIILIVLLIGGGIQ